MVAVKKVPEKEQYNTVDFMKFIFSICIVGIHTNLLETEASMVAWEISSLLFRTAVPFFFIVGGFFFAKDLFSIPRDKIGSVLKKYINRFIPPLLVWGGVGLLFQVYDLIISGKSILYICAYAIRTIFYPLGAMWYLLATVIGTAIVVGIYFFFKRWKLILACYSICAYIILLVCNNYYFLADGGKVGEVINIYMRIFVSARNGVFLAPVFIGMGFLLRSFFYSEKNMNNIRHYIPIMNIGCIVSLILLGIEAFLIYNETYLDDRGYFICQLFFLPAFVFFCLCHNIKMNLPYKLLRRLSTSIFFIHSAIINVITHLTGDINTSFLFIITVCVAVILSLITYKINLSQLKLIFG